MLIGNYLYNIAIVPHEHPEDYIVPVEEKEAARQWVRKEADAEEVSVMAEDGFRLCGRYIAASPQNQGRSPYGSGHVYAVCLHGINSNGAFAGPYARHYHRLGCHALLPDHRGFGRTGGGYVGYGVKDHRDLVCWIRWIIQRDPEARIILHGESMGAAIVLLACGAPDLPGNVIAAVADSSYTSIREEFSDSLRNLTVKWLPAEPFMELLRWTIKRRAGYDMNEGDVIGAVARSQTPMLFLHGLADETTDYHMSLRMFHAAHAEKDIALFKGMDHVNTVGRKPEEYWEAVHRFLDPIVERAVKTGEE